VLQRSMISVLTKRVLAISSRIVSVLIIGGWMMSVRRIEGPGRALAWSEMVRTPRSQFFFHTLRLSSLSCTSPSSATYPSPPES
jgi:hypothetical protein